MATLFPIVVVLFLVGIAFGGRFCPKKSDKQCFVRDNKCCSEEDCGRGEICCDENCGNTCYDPESTDQGGTRAKEYPVCQLGIVTSDLYCPKRPKILCAQTVNRCCNDCDCAQEEFCCKEACGTMCRRFVDYETDGQRFVPTRTCVTNVVINW